MSSHPYFILKLQILFGESVSLNVMMTVSPRPNSDYRKIPKFSDARKLRCDLPKIQTKRPNLSVFRQKDASGIANSEDSDQTAPLGAV